MQEMINFLSVLSLQAVLILAIKPNNYYRMYHPLYFVGKTQLETFFVLWLKFACYAYVMWGVLQSLYL